MVGVSRSLRVVGFCPPDAEYQRLADVYAACTKAGLDPPEAVQKFFDWRAPDPAGMEVPIDLKEWSTDWAMGYEVDVEHLPPQVKTLRVYMT